MYWFFFTLCLICFSTDFCRNYRGSVETFCFYRFLRCDMSTMGCLWYGDDTCQENLCIMNVCKKIDLITLLLHLCCGQPNTRCSSWGSSRHQYLQTTSMQYVPTLKSPKITCIIPCLRNCLGPTDVSCSERHRLVLLRLEAY